VKIENMTKNSTIYTCNTYLVTGTWNALDDVNTIVDAGRDRSVFDIIDAASTGVGKKRVEQVILTHSHYDHASLVPEMKMRYGCRVMAFTESLADVDVVLQDGDVLRIGDGEFRVVHAPFHSNDSILLINEQEAVVFSGDVNIFGVQPGQEDIRDAHPLVRRVMHKRQCTVYPGHGPILENCGHEARQESDALKQKTGAQ
jgi:glyoxylase-like metal-dependent hydrolase (beta-lactamase superfamily II)